MKEYDVKIRFNTNYGKTNNLKWRILVDGKEQLVDEIKINCPCYTSQDIVKGDDGLDVQKFHISCKPKDVSFSVGFINKKTTVELR